MPSIRASCSRTSVEGKAVCSRTRRRTRDWYGVMIVRQRFLTPLEGLPYSVMFRGRWRWEWTVMGPLELGGAGARQSGLDLGERLGEGRPVEESDWVGRELSVVAAAADDVVRAVAVAEVEIVIVIVIVVGKGKAW